MKVLLVVVILITGALFTVVCSDAQSGATASVMQSGGRITKAEMGSKLDASTDELEVNPTNEFAPATPRIICRWQAEGVKAAIVVRGVWIAEDTGGVMEKDTMLSESKKNLPPVASMTASFRLSTDSPWPVGKYRLDLYLGDDLSRSVPFIIKEK
jgi:hypothetical protein